MSVSGGSLTINGANAMAGITLSSGLLVLNNANALGSGPLTITGGSLDSTSGSAVLANNTENWNGDFTFIGTQSLNLGSGVVTLGEPNLDRQRRHADHGRESATAATATRLPRPARAHSC